MTVTKNNAHRVAALSLLLAKMIDFSRKTAVRRSSIYS
jgi:hypothetical protein